MNKHTNKNKQSKPFPSCLEPVEFPHMPRQVALSVLAKQNMPNRILKRCRAALETRYQSTREAKPLQQVLMNKFMPATLAQLDKWARRTTAKRLSVQHRWCETDPESPYRAALERMAERLDTTTDCLQAVIKSRGKKPVVAQ